MLTEVMVNVVTRCNTLF